MKWNIVDNYCAIKFRKKYSNFSFTQIGYSSCDENLEKMYLELVDVEIKEEHYGDEEIHKCKCCNKIVYSKLYR